jgi:hypothetical protein
MFVSMVLVGTVSAAYAGPRVDLIDCGDTDAPLLANPNADRAFIVPPSIAVTELPEDYKAETGRGDEKGPDDVRIDVARKFNRGLASGE